MGGGSKGGGTTVVVPGPSTEEKQLQAEQTQILREQRDMLQRQLREQNLLAQQVLFPKLRLKPTLGPGGEITGFTQEAPTEEESLQQQINLDLLRRSQQALRGELPVDPILARTIGEEERSLRERLGRQLGPGFETSTPGIEALQKFEESRTGRLEAFRRGELSLSEALSLGRGQEQAAQMARLLGAVGGVGQYPYGGAQTLGQIATGFGAAQQPFFQQRALETNAALQNAMIAQHQQATSSGLLGNIFGGLAQMGGTLGAAALLRKW